MRRRLFNVLAAASLVLCVATAFAAIRSFWVADVWIRADDKAQTSIALARNRLSLTWTNPHAAGGPVGVWVHASFDPTEFPLTPDSFLGFEDSSIDYGWFAWRTIAIRSWHLCTVLAVLPLLWLLRRFRFTSNLPGRCPACGYDLRATPERCPECGRVAEKVDGVLN
jgi:hypothetical protein